MITVKKMRPEGRIEMTELWLESVLLIAGRDEAGENLAGSRHDKKVQHRSAHEAAKLHNGQRGQQLAARLVLSPNEGQQAEDGGERGHDDGNHALG